MSEPILVASPRRLRDGVIALLLGTACGLVGTVFGPGQFLFELCLLAAAVFSLTGVALLAYYFLTRRWVTILPDGFACQDRRGTIEYRNEDVACISVSHRSNYFRGKYRSSTRRFTVWVEKPPRPRQIVMTTTISPDQPDPLKVLVDRLSNHLWSAAREAWQQGNPVDGAGWRLDGKELHVTRRNQPTTTHFLADLTAVNVVDDMLCVWSRGQDAPQIQFPISSPNAYVLWLLLLRDIIPAGGVSSPSEGPLGRLLFERQDAIFRGISLDLLTLFRFSLIGLFAYLGMTAPPMLMVVAVLLFFEFGYFPLRSAATYAVFRAYEHGVFLKQWWGEASLRYADVATFTYNAERCYNHGLYVGTQISLRFETLPGAGAKSISYSRNFMNTDNELENLRDTVSGKIAERMMQEFSEKKLVIWLPWLKFLEEGLEYREIAFVGRKPATLIPYRYIDHFRVENGVFRLWQLGNSSRPAIQEKISEPNFFPGLCFLSAFYHPPENVPT